MTTSAKIMPGSKFPSLPVSLVDGDMVDPASESGWRLVIVYRGKHCPLCKKYFKTLNAMLDDLKSADVSVLAISADPKDKADADVAEEGWKFRVGYGLSIEQMRELGLYISEPRTPPETDRLFAEPGLFVINPEGRVQVVDISNAPFARPDLTSVLAGIKSIRERKFPIRGTFA